MVNQPNLWLKKGTQADKRSESTNIRIYRKILLKPRKFFLQAVSLRSRKPQYEQRSRQLWAVLSEKKHPKIETLTKIERASFFVLFIYLLLETLAWLIKHVKALSL